MVFVESLRRRSGKGLAPTRGGTPKQDSRSLRGPESDACRRRGRAKVSKIGSAHGETPSKSSRLRMEPNLGDCVMPITGLFRRTRATLIPARSCTQLSPEEAKNPHSAECGFSELREQDLNLRPSGYEPDELPGCSIPRFVYLSHPSGYGRIIAATFDGVKLFRQKNELFVKKTAPTALV